MALKPITPKSRANLFVFAAVRKFMPQKIRAAALSAYRAAEAVGHRPAQAWPSLATAAWLERR
ncbi:MAG: hypothetical protein K2Z80_36960 [Xanthobacteraceae bacterium]|nr:hypothetical protein [Xanthobacteraceae bacterium]